jgi:hypothetical protein
MADFISFPRDESLLSLNQQALQLALADAPYRVAPGYGMRSLKPSEWKSLLAEPDDDGLFDRLLVFEPPRKGFLYIVSVDVSNGIGQDRSVIDVIRVATIREPNEQVAQFVTDQIDPSDLAFVVDTVGRLYKGRDDMPAEVAIECGQGPGMTTQDVLFKQIGYPNLYVWQVLDNRALSKSFTTKLGWWTTRQSRPIIIQGLHHALKTVDPHTGVPDFRLNSPLTIRELRTFVSPGPVWMAEAAEGAFDDCVMSAAIGNFVAERKQQGYRETIHETRRRLSEESARLTARRQQDKNPVTPQTTDITAAELMGQPDPYESEWETNPHML